MQNISDQLRAVLASLQAEKIRSEFAVNGGLNDPNQIERVLIHGEAKLKNHLHPDPYIGTIILILQQRNHLLMIVLPTDQRVFFIFFSPLCLQFLTDLVAVCTLATHLSLKTLISISILEEKEAIN